MPAIKEFQLRGWAGRLPLHCLTAALSSLGHHHMEKNILRAELAAAVLKMGGSGKQNKKNNKGFHKLGTPRHAKNTTTPFVRSLSPSIWRPPRQANDIPLKSNQMTKCIKRNPSMASPSTAQELARQGRVRRSRSMVHSVKLDTY